VADQPMNQVEDLIAALHQHSPGETIPITILRNNQEQTLQVTLGNQP
jgi:S1-C subfamily serine protease